MEPIFKEVLKKSETLSKWCKEYIDTINVLEGAWNRLISLFENHHHIVAQQVFTYNYGFSTILIIQLLIKEHNVFTI